MKKKLVAVAAIALALSGCSAVEPASYPDTYRTVEDLRDAFVTAGGECPEWEQSNHIPLAAESGTCSERNVMSIYSTQAERDELLEMYKSISQEGALILIGENWIINDPTVRKLDPAIGGIVFSR